jgi:hypothetical protein
VSLGDEALRYAELGIRVFPLAWYGHEDKVAGTPLAKWGTHATTDTAQIRRWWRKWPNAGIGLACGDELGPGRYLFVLDLDRHDPNEDGIEALAELEAEHGPLPDGPRVLTAGDGNHIYLTAPYPITNSTGSLPKGIDVRGVGGYVVLPPSSHKSGGRHQWEHGHELGDLPIPEAPEWLLEILVGPAVDESPLERSETRADHYSGSDAPKPLDHWSKTVTFRDELLADGWQPTGARTAGGDGETWVRPGKAVAGGSSATLFDSGLLYVHSSNANVPARRSYDVIGYRVHASFRGDFSAAAKALGATQTDRPSNVDPETGEIAPKRRVRITQASTIKPRRVRWTWDRRIAVGSLALLAGPEGLGKSTVAYDLVARSTRGTLPGEYLGHPKSALICATEDAWDYTIVPRLMAHDADLDRVYRIDVVLDDHIAAPLTLPRDLEDLHDLAVELDVGFLILDPLMSRLDSSLDTHRDGEVRRALEPLVAVCEAAEISTIGLIHHNKSGSSDPLALVMASKAFTAVARSVNTVVWDPEDETRNRRLFGTPKNNLGRLDLPILPFTIEPFLYDVEDDDEPGSTGRVVWGTEIEGTIAEILSRTNRDPEKKTAETDAVRWLAAYMADNAREVIDLDGARAVEAADAIAAADANGHSKSTMQRARTRLGIDARKAGGSFRNRWFWVLPDEEPKPPRGDTQLGSSSSLGSSVPGQHEETEEPKIPALGSPGIFTTNRRLCPI